MARAVAPTSPSDGTELGADRIRDQFVPRLPLDIPQSEHVKSLVERFRIPPFTQLDGRSGAWQDRKQMWLSLGLRSHEGRSARFTHAAPHHTDDVSQKIMALSAGQSIFDPVLCELAYLWFVPPGGRILDPFAGGSVRGLVAAYLGYHYTGVDLSTEQVMSNRRQDCEWRDAGHYPDNVAPEWIEGDSADLVSVLGDNLTFDFLLSCPPYHDLERYSDDPRDLSNMEWKEFIDTYRAVIAGAVDRLADDRFAAFVVGEIRNPDGYYRHFVQETIDAFEMAGACYYNEALLVSPAGTLPLRAARQFVVSRKMGRTHQTVLIFVKGDPRRAATACTNAIAMEAALRSAGVDIADLPDDEDLSGMGHG